MCGDRATQYGESGIALSHSYPEVEIEHSYTQVTIHIMGVKGL
jgi:hypothetical protein